MRMKLWYLILASLMSANFVLAFDKKHDEKIVRGELVPREHPIARRTIEFATGVTSIEHKCTASIIRQDVLVTAAHCTARRDGGIFGRMIYFPPASYVLHGSGVRVKKVFTHPKFRKPGPHDIALIQLEEPLGPEFEPAPMLAPGTSLAVGQIAVIAGFGTTNPNSLSDGLLRQVRAPILDPGFDRGRSVIIDQTSGGACYGDSGGPAYIEENGELKLWGVVSRGHPRRTGGDCLHQAIFEKIDGHADFVRDSLARM